MRAGPGWCRMAARPGRFRQFWRLVMRRFLRNSLGTYFVLIALSVSVAISAAAPAQRGIAEVNGTKLYYEVAGSGPVVVLIHGGAVDSRAWDDQFSEFAKQFTVIRYDLRGSGQSASPVKPFSNTEDLYQLLQHLQVAKASLVGISRGGGMAFDFALDHPEMVASLVLISSNLSNVPKAYEDMFERTTEVGKKEGAAAAARVWGLDPYQGPQRKEAVPGVLKIIEENVVRFRHIDGSPAVRQLASSDKPRSERLTEIHVPTLLVFGEKDNVDARANYERWAKGIPGAKRVTFPRAAHLVPIDQPAEFNRTVLDFLSGLQ
ncbi:MAG: alpha/beta hydrolase [Acidobacteria bacterium]|nr:alpha/beta hydrolase [Acidobacteriota bacterium]